MHLQLWPSHRWIISPFSHYQGAREGLVPNVSDVVTTYISKNTEYGTRAIYDGLSLHSNARVFFYAPPGTTDGMDRAEIRE